MKNVNWVKVFIYVSLLFLIIYLIRADFLVWPKILHVKSLIISILFLFIGFFTNAYTWHIALQKKNVKVSYTQSLASLGLSIFGKYIPGKLWIIVGRATYVARRCNIELKDATAISLNVQFLMLWSGLVVGSICLMTDEGWKTYGTLTGFSIVLLSIAIFSSLVHKFVQKIIFSVFKKSISFPRLSFREAIKIIPYFIFHWANWSLAFYFLAASISPSEISLLTGFAFAMAGTIGIMAIIAPGGIGVREGVLTGLMVVFGLDMPIATSIAITSRLWFLIGEVFVFGMGWFADRLSQQK